VWSIRFLTKTSICLPNRINRSLCVTEHRALHGRQNLNILISFSKTLYFIQLNKSNPRPYSSPDPQAIFFSVAQKNFITKLGLKALPFFRSIEYKMATGSLITVEISARLQQTSVSQTKRTSQHGPDKWTRVCTVGSDKG
jgi:hypothetical protein